MEGLSDEESSATCISHAAVLAALELALQYIEQQPEVQAPNLILLIKWRDLTVLKLSEYYSEANHRCV